MIAFTLPFHLVSDGNDHRNGKAQYFSRIQPQREAATDTLNKLIKQHEPEFIKFHKIPTKQKRGKKVIYCFHELVSPVLVKLTRVYGPGKRPLDKHENLPSSFKPIVDGLTIAFGLKSDDSELVKWEPNYQRPGKESFAVIEIFPREVAQVAVEDVPAYVLGAEGQGAKLVGGRLRLLQDGRVIDVSLKVG